MAAELPLDELSTIFARLNSMLLSEETVDSAVVLLSEAAKVTIPEALGAGTTVIDADGHQVSTGSTDRIVRQGDDLQYSTGEGPCLSAWAAQTPMRVDDVASDPRWPRWSEAVSELPIQSVVSVPLTHDGKTLGALKVYSASKHVFTQETERLLMLFAGPAAALLSHIQTEDLPAQLSESLQSAMATRDTINLAKGVLMSQHGIDADTATRRLLRLARAEGTSLLECSERVIASRRPEDGGSR